MKHLIATKKLVAINFYKFFNHHNNNHRRYMCRHRLLSMWHVPIVTKVWQTILLLQSSIYIEEIQLKKRK